MEALKASVAAAKRVDGEEKPAKKAAAAGSKRSRARSS
jgi:hypothetical protein